MVLYVYDGNERNMCKIGESIDIGCIFIGFAVY